MVIREQLNQHNKGSSATLDTSALQGTPNYSTNR